MKTANPGRSKVFVSYSHKDAKWLERLRVHLKPLEWQGILELWDDTMLPAGSNWQEEIGKAIASAKVAILLISADFLASDFVITKELPRLLVAAQKEGLVILQIIISPSQFEEIKALATFQAVNPPSKPLISMSKSKQEQLFVGVAKAIQEAVSIEPSERKQGDIAPSLEAYGNKQGAAAGVVVLDETRIHSVFRETGRKVILMTSSPHPNLPFDMIAGLIVVGNLTDLSHISLMLNELRIPVVFTGATPSIDEGTRIGVDSDRTGSVDKSITFTHDFIRAREDDYEQAVRKNIGSGVQVPEALMALVLEDNPAELPGELTLWAQRWGPLHEITRNVLPLVGHKHFADVAVVCETLCSEYQWPVGRQEARRVLPQLAYYRRKETLSLLKSWISSGSLPLIKAAAMALGNVALMDLDLARVMVKTILDHPNDTVVKEAPRAVTNINDVDRDLADEVVRRCRSFKSIPELQLDYRNIFYGLALAAIPGYLALSPDLAFEKVEYAVRLINKEGLADTNVAIARNYIFANVLLLAEVNPKRLTASMDLLRPFTIERHIQVDLFVAASRLGAVNRQVARDLFELGETHLDGSLAAFSERIRKKLFS